MSEAMKESGLPFRDALPLPDRTQPANARNRFKPARLLKIGLASLLLIGALAGVLAGHGRVTADNAVVSAYVLSVRAPIEGQVFGLDLHVGDAVVGRPVLAHIADDRVDDDRLVELRSEAIRLIGERQAIEDQSRTLTAMRASLTARAEDHRRATVEYAAATTEEGVAQLRSLMLRLGLAQRDMARKATLSRSGDAPLADVDRVTQDAAIAAAQVVSQGAHQAYLRVREQAAAQGVLLDNGGNDVSYSIQRIDEIDLRIAESNRADAVLAASQIATASRLEGQERRHAARSSASLDLPPRGMIWKLSVSNGERVGVGDTLAQVIDCQSSFIVAAIPQRQFSLVEIGSVAKIRLSGESTDRQGRVLSVTGDASISGDRNLAAAPVADRATTAVVRVGIDPSGNNGGECLVGRTARVLLPVAGGGILAQIQNSLP